MIKKYVAEYPVIKGVDLPPLEVVFQAGDKGSANAIALIKLNELQQSGQQYDKPKVRVYKGDKADDKIDFANITLITKPYKPAETKQPLPVETKQPVPVETHHIAWTLDKLTTKINELFPGETLRLENVPADLYHASQGIGSTGLKHFVDCPKKYKAYIDGKIKFVKKHMTIGSAAHCLILEPKKFDTLYRELPPEIKVRRGKAWEALQADNPDTEFLSKAEYQDVLDMADSVMETYGSMFEKTANEVSYWKRDAETNLILKSRLDSHMGDLAIDLKTSKSSNPRRFAYTAADFSYHLQEALYCEVSGVKEFIFCVVESSAPFVCTLNQFSEDDRELARKEMRRALNKLKQCQDKNNWPGYSEKDVVNEISLPAFRRDAIIAEEDKY